MKLTLYKKYFKTRYISLEKQLEIIDNICIFLNQGYSIYDSLCILENTFNFSHLYYIFETGEPISVIFEKLKFNDEILLVIKNSLHSNDLVHGLNKSKFILQKKIDYKNSLIELLKYPTLLIIVSIGSLIFISKFLLPQFEKLYISINLEIDLKIKIINFMIDILPNIIFLFVIIISLVVIYFKSCTIKRRLKILTTYKFISKYYLNLYNYIFCLNVTNLLNVGLKIDECFEILANQDYNIYLKHQSVEIISGLSQGKLLSECMEGSIYNKELINLVKNGENSNCLNLNLQTYLKFLENSNKKKTAKFMFIVQPLFYLGFGMLIILLYASIFLPMFEMMNQI